MQYPYVSAPDRAFLTAHVSTATLLTAVVWARVPKRAVAVLLLLGIWIAALAPQEIRWLAETKLPHPPYAARLDWVLGVSSLFYVVATLFHWKRAPQLVAVFAVYLANQAGQYVRGSDFELAALHIVIGGLLAGLVARPAPVLVPVKAPRLVPYETALFAIGLAAASFVAIYVLDRFVASGDEWAYQYQADLFAHGKVYGPVPECPSPYKTYWIFYWMDRAFCQYTPGWPLILAPFQGMGVYWLANPILFGITLVGVSRLARRAVSGNRPADAPLSKEAYAAGLLAPLVLAGSGSMLLNAGSLFSHPLVCALFAWCAEAMFTLTSPGLTRRRELAWGFALGLLAALLLATRPSDGAVILPTIALYGLYATFKRTLSWRAIGAAAVGFLPMAAATLVILRMQLGEWFQTGYSLTDKFHPWATIRFDWPAPDEWKYGIPLATGDYCFWPCSAAAAALGIVVAFRRGRRVPLVLGGAALLINAFYSAVVAGRHTDWGYGPRYVLALLVPTAVFAGVALAPLLVQLSERKLEPFIRAGLGIGAVVYGTWTIGSMLYPVAKEEIRAHGAPFRAIKANKMKNAVVVFGRTALDPNDLTQNLPSVKNPDVIYLRDSPPEDLQCVRRLYPDRKWYRADGFYDVQFVPLD